MILQKVYSEENVWFFYVLEFLVGLRLLALLHPKFLARPLITYNIIMINDTYSRGCSRWARDILIL